MNTEAMKLALEALEPVSTFGRVGSRDVDTAKAQEAITALQEELAQQEQEPVAGCVCRWNSEGDRVVTCERHQGWLEVIAEWADRAREAEKKLKVLNTTPPARKPLTEGKLSWLWSDAHNDTTDRMAFQVFARAIESAHGIKE